MLNNSIYAILTTTDIKLPKAVFQKKKHRLKNFNEKKLNIVPKTEQQQKKTCRLFFNKDNSLPTNCKN